MDFRRASDRFWTGSSRTVSVTPTASAVLRGVWKHLFSGRSYPSVTGHIAGLPILVGIWTTLRRARQEEDRRLKSGWLLLATAMGLYSVGLRIGGYHTVIYTRVPFPTVADPLFLVFAPRNTGCCAGGRHISCNREGTG